MKLLTKQLEERFKKIGSQENAKDPIAIAKFFNPTGAGTWIATEYDSKNKIFYGFVSIFGDHWGSFSLKELEDLKLPFGLGIERDMYFEEQPISKVFPKAVL
ncbi:MAG: DUF2958 domain-containing protein [Novosphingobium sp.]|nr:DUF2958 domain-containing protein [Novosphingobium sp.]